MKIHASAVTHNLLLGNWTKEKLRRLFESQLPLPLLPPLDSARWREVGENPVAQSLAKPLIRRAMVEWNRPLPQLSDALYALFHRTGERLQFEGPYFERRRRFERATIALLLSRPGTVWRERLIQSVTDKLRVIFEEDAWALPAHVTTASGKDRSTIDLFNAETANFMAEALNLFSEVLPKDLRRQIRNRLRDEIWESYRRKPELHLWIKDRNNWNAVCHQGVLGSALSLDDDAERLAEMLMLARLGLPNFLKGFAKDGGTSEGPGYWGYGFGLYSVLNEQLEMRTRGKLSLFAGNPHIRKIARFGPLASLPGGQVVNFSDTLAEHILRPNLLDYLGKRLREKVCQDFSAVNYEYIYRNGIDRRNGIKTRESRGNLWCVRLLLRCPRQIVKKASVTSDGFFPDLGVIIGHGRDRRGHDWDFAAKAGHNAEHHNHNDCANWLLHIDGMRYVAEIGRPEYVKNYFWGNRYGFLAARSLGHSLPVINGCEQAAGRRYASKVRSHLLTDKEMKFSVDATRCYPAKARCRRFWREFHWDKHNGRLRVEDCIETVGEHLVEGALISIFPISVTPSCARIQTKTGVLVIRPLANTRLGRVEPHAYSDHAGKKARIYRLVFGPSQTQPIVHFGLELHLAK